MSKETLRKLLDQKKNLEARIERLKEDEVKALATQIRRQIQEDGFTIDEIAPLLAKELLPPREVIDIDSILNVDAIKSVVVEKPHRSAYAAKKADPTWGTQDEKKPATEQKKRRSKRNPYHYRIYRHPDDASLVWTRRNKQQPQWIQNFLKQGVDIETLRIDEN